MKSRRRRLRIEVWYLVILAAVILAAVLFALLFKGGKLSGNTPGPSEPPVETPDQSPRPIWGCTSRSGPRANGDTRAIPAPCPLRRNSSPRSLFAGLRLCSHRKRRQAALRNHRQNRGLGGRAPVFQRPGVLGGLAAVEYNQRWGYINPAGEVIADPVFTKAGDFSGGLALVEKNGKLGYINATGQFKITNQYDYATDFSEGLAFVAKTENDDSKYYLITDGEEVVARSRSRKPGCLAAAWPRADRLQPVGVLQPPGQAGL